VNGSVDSGAPKLDQPPLPQFARNAQLAAISWTYNYQSAVWRLPYALRSDGMTVPGMAALLANRSGPTNGNYPVDYSIDPESIPAISAHKILDGSFDRRAVAGKDVVIGVTSNSIGDVYFIPGFRQAGGVYVHVIGAETLKSGKPVELGWIPAFLAALALAALVLRRSDERHVALVALAIPVLAIGPAILESRLIFIDVTPGLFVLFVTGGVLLRRRFQARGLVDSVSGLPNLAALKSGRLGRDKALIVARVLNYAEVVAALPPACERQLVEQIVTRLSVGARERVFYQGDQGIFAWFDEPRKPSATISRRSTPCSAPLSAWRACRSTCRSASESRSGAAGPSPTGWEAPCSLRRKRPTTG
jgi:hypothetical protein